VPSRALGNLLALAMALSLLAACAQQQATPAKPGVNLAGFPPAFRDGYADGCNSARSLVGKKRNEERYKTDSLYAQGWRDGNDVCKGATTSKP